MSAADCVSCRRFLGGISWLTVIYCSMLAAVADSPNVLFIAVDDLNDWVGCLEGHPQAHTPNIDRLAARGILFTNAHCAAPACNPSRAAVFSGRMPNVTGVWSNESRAIDQVYPKDRLLPTVFKEAGYLTVGTGKLFHKGAKDQFEIYQSYEQRWSPFASDAVRYTPTELPSKGSRNPRHVVSAGKGRQIVLPLNRMPSDRRPNAPSGESFDWGGLDFPDSDWGDTRCTDWAIRRLGEQPDQPLLLCIGYYRPHIPLFAPMRFFERFQGQPGQLPPYRADDLQDLGSAGREWALAAVTAGLHSTVEKHGQWQAAVEAYLACVSYVDHEIGRLLEALDQSERADNTLIVLWSDHGWHLGEKDHWGKWTGWERATKVPLIVVPPRNRAQDFASAGSSCDAPVGLIDLYPTLVELCGISRPPALDGESLVPLLKQTQAPFRQSTLTMFDDGNASVRTRRWRYLRYSDGSEELYDLRDDPHEWHNLVRRSEFQSTAAMMRSQLEQHLTRLQPDRELK